MIYVKPPLSVLPCPDSSVGPEEHEAVPAGHSVFTQSGGGVRGPEDRVSRHQEHEEEPQLPQLRPLHQSGNVQLDFVLF